MSWNSVGCMRQSMLVASTQILILWWRHCRIRAVNPLTQPTNSPGYTPDQKNDTNGFHRTQSLRKKIPDLVAPLDANLASAQAHSATETASVLAKAQCAHVPGIANPKGLPTLRREREQKFPPAHVASVGPAAKVIDRSFLGCALRRIPGPGRVSACGNKAATKHGHRLPPLSFASHPGDGLSVGPAPRQRTRPLPTQVDGGHCEASVSLLPTAGPPWYAQSMGCLQRDLVTDPVRHGCPPECTKVW